jgi:hypothetical protein
MDSITNTTGYPFNTPSGSDHLGTKRRTDQYRCLGTSLPDTAEKAVALVDMEGFHTLSIGAESTLGQEGDIRARAVFPNSDGEKPAISDLTAANQVQIATFAFTNGGEHWVCVCSDRLISHATNPELHSVPPYVLITVEADAAADAGGVALIRTVLAG